MRDLERSFRELVEDVKSFGILATQFERFGSINESELLQVISSEVVSSNIDIDMLYEYNEYLSENGHECYYSMDELDDILSGCTPMEAVRMVYYGNFSMVDEYFTFDGYANLESVGEYSLVRQMQGDSDFCEYLAQQLLDELTDAEVEELKEAGNLALAAGW